MKQFMMIASLAAAVISATIAAILVSGSASAVAYKQSPKAITLPKAAVTQDAGFCLPKILSHGWETNLDQIKVLQIRRM